MGWHCLGWWQRHASNFRRHWADIIRRCWQCVDQQWDWMGVQRSTIKRGYIPTERAVRQLHACAGRRWQANLFGQHWRTDHHNPDKRIGGFPDWDSDYDCEPWD
jgi:hypothetical protein